MAQVKVLTSTTSLPNAAPSTELAQQVQTVRLLVRTDDI